MNKAHTFNPSNRIRWWEGKKALSIQVFHPLHQIKLTFPETSTLPSHIATITSVLSQGSTLLVFLNGFGKIQLHDILTSQIPDASISKKLIFFPCSLLVFFFFREWNQLLATSIIKKPSLTFLPPSHSSFWLSSFVRCHLYFLILFFSFYLHHHFWIQVHHFLPGLLW